MPTRPVACVLATALLAASLLAASPPACASGQCGLQPLKPLPPLGCRDLVAVFVCDAERAEEELPGARPRLVAEFRRS